MQKTLLGLFLSVGLLPLAGCLETSEPEGRAMQGCKISDARDFQVWINGMPGPNSPKLIVLFSGVTPTPGYSVKGSVSAVQEMAPPIYIIDIVATPPSGPVAQVLTRSDIRLEIPVHHSEVSAVELTCAGESVFRSNNVETAY